MALLRALIFSLCTLWQVFCMTNLHLLISPWLSPGIVAALWIT